MIKHNNLNEQEISNVKYLDMFTFCNEEQCKLVFLSLGKNSILFKAVNNNDIKYIIKFVPYKIEYGHVKSLSRPENMDIQIRKLFNNLLDKKETPHINKMLGFFESSVDILKNFDDSAKEIIGPFLMNDYKKFISKFNKNIYYNDNLLTIIMEYENEGDLLNFLKKHSAKMQEIHWKIILFQIISTITVINVSYPNFKHNCFTLTNILINKEKNKNKESVIYRINKKDFVLPSIGYKIKITDFSLVTTGGIIDNDKQNNNHIDDLDALFKELINLQNTIKIPVSIQLFILRFLCKKMIFLIFFYTTN